MLVTSKQFEAYKKQNDLETNILKDQIESLFNLISFQSEQIGELKEELEPPQTMGGK